METNDKCLVTWCRWCLFRGSINDPNHNRLLVGVNEKHDLQLITTNNNNTHTKHDDDGDDDADDIARIQSNICLSVCRKTRTKKTNCSMLFYYCFHCPLSATEWKTANMN